MKPLTAILVFFLFNSSFAQQSTLKIDASKSKGTAPYYADAVFLDTRPDGTTNGFVLNNSSREILAVVTKQPLPVELKNFYQELIGKNADNQNFLLLNIRRFLVAESKGLSDRGSFSFKADCYEGYGDNFRLVKKIDTLFELKGANITTRLKGRINYELARMMVALQQPVEESADGRWFSLNDIKQQEQLEKNARPLFKDSSVQRGIYATYEELLNNMPSITSFATTGTPKKDFAIFKTKDGVPDGDELKQSAIYAYADSGKIYVRYQNKFRRLFFRDDDFHLLAKVNMSANEKNAGIIAASSVAFGILGGLTVGILLGYDDSGNTWYEFKLDYNSGYFVPEHRLAKKLTELEETYAW
jgi:hypothetical protein